MNIIHHYSLYWIYSPLANLLVGKDVGNWFIVYQMSQILPYAIFRSGTDLSFWGVTKTHTEVHYLCPPCNCFFFQAVALRGKSRARKGIYVESFPLNWSDTEKKPQHILIAIEAISLFSLKIFPEGWGWCRTSSTMEARLTPQQYRNKTKRLLNSVPRLGWEETLWSEQGEDPGSMNYNTNHGSYFTSKGWGEKEGMIHSARTAWCRNKGPQFQLHSCQKIRFHVSCFPSRHLISPNFNYFVLWSEEASRKISKQHLPSLLCQAARRKGWHLRTR